MPSVNSFNCQNNPLRHVIFYPHCTAEETKAQRSQISRRAGWCGSVALSYASRLDDTLPLGDGGESSFLLMHPLQLCIDLTHRNFFLPFVFFLGPHPWHMEVPSLGV